MCNETMCAVLLHLSVQRLPPETAAELDSVKSSQAEILKAIKESAESNEPVWKVGKKS